MKHVSIELHLKYARYGLESLRIVNEARIRQNIPEFRMIHVSIEFHLEYARYASESSTNLNKARIRRNIPEFRMFHVDCRPTWIFYPQIKSPAFYHIINYSNPYLDFVPLKYKGYEVIVFAHL